jgi:hypothetical protein
MAGRFLAARILDQRCLDVRLGRALALEGDCGEQELFG